MSQRFSGLAALLLCLLLAACGAPPNPSWGAMTLIDGNILLANNERLVLVNPANGALVELRNADGAVRTDANGAPRQWNIAAPGNNATSFYAAPVILDENTYLVGTFTHKLHTLDLNNAFLDRGEPNPAGITLPGQIVASPLVTEDLIYVAFSDNNHGVMTYDRSILTPENAPAANTPPTPVWAYTTDHGVWATPLLVEDTLYFASLNHNLYALDAATGEERWTANLEGAAAATPVYLDGMLYIGSFAKKIFQIDAETGEIVNTYATGDWVWGAPVIFDGVLYAGDMSGNLYALDISEDLSLIWTQDVGGAVRPSPIVTEEYVIVASRDHRVYWRNRSDGTQVIDPEGNPLVRELAGEILSELLLIPEGETVPEPLLIVSSMANSQMMVAYTVNGGRLVWEYRR